MEICTFFLLPTIVMGTTFTLHNGSPDITAIGMPSDTTIANIDDNTFGSSGGIPLNFLTSANFPNLYKIDLDSNQLYDNHIPDFAFSGIGSTLTWLDLWENELTVIRTNQFKGLAILDFLELDNNHITTIQSGQCILSYLHSA